MKSSSLIIGIIGSVPSPLLEFLRGVALRLTSDDFTYTGSTLYLFSAIDVSLLCAFACMPLLKPVGEKLVSSSAVAWIKTLAQTTLSRAFKASSGQHDWAKSCSVEGPNLESAVVGGRNSMSSKDKTSSEQGIYVDCRVEQHTYLSNHSLEMEP